MWTRRSLLALPVGIGVPLMAAVPMTKLRIEVRDHRGKPVQRAAVIVRFVEGRSVKKLGKKTAHRWELKTNQEGVANMPRLPQGKILVQVIAEKFQTFGEEFEVYEEEKTLEIELNPPQPQYSAH